MKNYYLIILGLMLTLPTVFGGTALVDEMTPFASSLLSDFAYDLDGKGSTLVLGYSSSKEDIYYQVIKAAVSQDKGVTWDTKEIYVPDIAYWINTRDPFVEVSVVNENTFYIFHGIKYEVPNPIPYTLPYSTDFRKGLVSKTTDGGETWNTTEVAYQGVPPWGTSLSHGQIYALNESTVYGLFTGKPTQESPEGFYFFKTRNSGETWEHKFIDDAEFIQSSTFTIKVIDEQTILAWFTMASVISLLYTSIDGGETWTEQSVPYRWGVAGYHSGIYAENISEVTLVESSSLDVEKTINGGETWSTITSLPVGHALPSNLITTTTGKLLAPFVEPFDDVVVAMSDNQGETWALQHTLSNIDERDTPAFHAANDEEWHIAFMETTESYPRFHQIKVASSFDAGQSWDQNPPEEEPEPGALPPEITSEPLEGIREGRAYNYHIRVNDPDGDSRNVTYQLLQGPQGMEIINNSHNANVHWRRAVIGSYPVIVQVTDEAGATALQEFTLTVISKEEWQEMRSTEKEENKGLKPLNRSNKKDKNKRLKNKNK